MATVESIESILKFRWNNLIQSIAASAESDEYRQHVNLRASVKAEAERFIAQPAPTSENEWQTRRKDAAMLRKQWSVRLSNLRCASERLTNGRLNAVRRAG